MPTITDWIMVGITFVYVVATIFICYFNGKAAKASQGQIEEMKRQYALTNRPIITVDVFFEKRLVWVLRFTNRGAATAYNVKINFDKEFTDSIPETKYREAIESNAGKHCTIGVGQHIDFFIGTNKGFRSNALKHIKGRVLYVASQDAAFGDDFDIDPSAYVTIYSITTESEDLLAELKVQNSLIEEQNKLLLRIVNSQSEIDTNNTIEVDREGFHA